MKKTGSLIIFFFLLLFAYTKIAGPIPFAITSVSTVKSDTFSVTGEGKVTLKPDIAIINAGVTAQAPTVKGAQDLLNAAINRVSVAVKSVGVKDKDIQTSNYSIYPTYDYANGNQHITGYSANSSLTIKTRDITRTNEIIDQVTANGANQVGGISFDIDDKTKGENEARTLAVAEAKRKADDASRIAGFKLGRIVNYSENFGNFRGPIPMMAKAEVVGTVDHPPTQVEPGSLEVTITVTLSYDLP